MRKVVDDSIYIYICDRLQEEDVFCAELTFVQDVL